MSLATQALQALESRLPKVIDARTHGFIDYGHATFFLTLAVVLRKKNPPAALAAFGTGAFVLVQSLLTDYPLGASKVISFSTHGKMDASFAALSPMIPQLLGFSDTKAAAVFRANGLIEATVAGLTDFSDASAQLQRSAS